MNGADFIRDMAADTEERVVEGLMLEMIIQYLEQNDPHKILSLTAAGKKETEISDMVGISRSGVNKKKRRLLRKLAELLCLQHAPFTKTRPKRFPPLTRPFCLFLGVPPVRRLSA